MNFKDMLNVLLEKFSPSEATKPISYKNETAPARPYMTEDDLEPDYVAYPELAKDYYHDRSLENPIKERMLGYLNSLNNPLSAVAYDSSRVIEDNKDTLDKKSSPRWAYYTAGKGSKYEKDRVVTAKDAPLDTIPHEFIHRFFSQLPRTFVAAADQHAFISEYLWEKYGDEQARKDLFPILRDTPLTEKEYRTKMYPELKKRFEDYAWDRMRARTAE